MIGAITEIISHGHSAIFIAAAILPHGIFEIPAFILAAALGFLWRSHLSLNGTGPLIRLPMQSVLHRLFIFCVVPLIAMAAVVEAFITRQSYK